MRAAVEGQMVVVTVEVVCVCVEGGGLLRLIFMNMPLHLFM